MHKPLSQDGYWITQLQPAKLDRIGTMHILPTSNDHKKSTFFRLEINQLAFMWDQSLNWETSVRIVYITAF